MKIRHVSIRNFRGIQACDWPISSSLVCLVGPGDSTKTTLLDAIGLALSRSYQVPLSDADFYNCDISKPIVIEVAVADLPAQLIEERAFGFDRSGVHPDGSLQHDPDDDGAEDCLVVRFSVDASLEPTWRVVRPGGSEEDEKPISAEQRRRLGFFRVGEKVDLHMRWGRTSALAAMTEDSSGATSVVLNAQRSARDAAFDALPPTLAQVTEAVVKRSRELGVPPDKGLRPGLEPTSGSSANSILLHEDTVPLTSKGLGTRRLASLAIQAGAVDGGSIVAIDEVELGLDPHRLAHALRYLRDRAVRNELQVFITTHSPVAVTTLDARDLAVVRSDAGTTQVRQLDAEGGETQGAVRGAPVALLARRVLVGEGSTEVGLVRGLCRQWDAEQADQSLPTSVTSGLEIVDGHGDDSAAKRARVFSSLGYATATLLDNDVRSIDSAVAEAKEAGVEVIRWSEGRALEDEIVEALTEEGLADFIALAIAEHGEQSVLGRVSAHLGVSRLEGTDPVKWVDHKHDLPAIRRAIAAAAKGETPQDSADDANDRGRPKRNDRQGWFKRQSGGGLLADLLIEHRPTLGGTPLAERLRALRRFIFEGEANAPDEGSGDENGR